MIDNLAAGIPILMTVLGAIGPFLPLKAWGKGAYVTAFVVLGIAWWLADMWARENQTIELLGGDQFPIVSAMFTNSGQFPLVISNQLDKPALYDVEVELAPRDSYLTDKKTVIVGTLHANAMFQPLNITAGPGIYLIEMHTKAGGDFTELMRLTRNNNQSQQCYYIRERGSDKRLMDTCPGWHL